MLYSGENQSMVISFVGLFVVAVLFALGVLAFDFDGRYGIFDCGVKWGAGSIQQDDVYLKSWQ